MKAVKIGTCVVAGLACITLLAGCDEDDVFDSFEARASVYYYNQITSKGAADPSALTTDFAIDADEGDSVQAQGYSTTDDASEMEIGLDQDDIEDGVTVRGTSQTGATLFSKRARLSEDSSYVAVSYGDTSLGSVTISIWRQDESEVPSGSARFRIINTVNPAILADIYSLDLRIRGEDNLLAEGLLLGDVTDYQTVDSGTLYLEVLKNGATPEQEIDTVDCRMTGGHAYDAILAFKDPLNPPTDSDQAEDDLALYCHEQDKP